eukprot:SAG31_NODE_6021_length_2206_cov_1.444708_1_plen_414_part_00
MVTIFGTCHWVACLWFAVGSYNDPTLKDVDGGPLLGWTNKKYSGQAANASLGDKYVATYYWALMNIMTVDSNDGGDILPRTTDERLASMFTMLLGGSIFGLIVGNLMDLAQSVGDGTKKQEKLIHSFCNERKLPPTLVRRIRGYFGTLHAIKCTAKDEDGVFQSLPSKFAEDLAQILQYASRRMHRYGARPFLWKIPFCQTLGHNETRRMCSAMKYMRIQPPHVLGGECDASNYIMRQGDVSSDMYVIIEGMVRVERNNQALGKLRPADFFGELGVLVEENAGHPLKRLRSAYALVPNTLLGFFTVHDFIRLRSILPALDHAMAKMTARVLQSRPTLTKNMQQTAHLVRTDSTPANIAPLANPRPIRTIVNELNQAAQRKEVLSSLAKIAAAVDGSYSLLSHQISCIESKLCG